MKKLCTIELESGTFDYLLDIGKRSNAYLNIRDGVVTDYPITEIHIEGKKICRSTIRLQENDVFVAMSDGCPHASADETSAERQAFRRGTADTLPRKMDTR